MKELSLNILDIVENSVHAGATRIEIVLTDDGERFSFTVTDNGCGMTQSFLEKVVDPFSTSRTTRKVGLGIPFLKLAAEQTGGSVTLQSSSKAEFPDAPCGTVITATFFKNHIDFVPLGDINATICTLIQGSPDVDFLFRHTMPGGEVTLDTAEIRQTLGDEVPLNVPEVLTWIREYLEEAYAACESQS